MEIDIGLFWRGRLSPRTYQLTITDVPVRTCAEMLTGGELELCRPVTCVICTRGTCTSSVVTVVLTCSSSLVRDVTNRSMNLVHTRRASIVLLTRT